MEDDEIKENVERAIQVLKTEDPVLAVESVHERSTAHRLAVHMEPLFAGWNIDCEYDRYGTALKELEGIAECDDKRKTDRILPDIIVHRRREDDNLLVVELKKNDPEDLCDFRKLELFTALNGNYRYQLGLYININNGAFNCVWFKDGAEQN